MPDVLDHGRPERIRPALRSLVFDGTVQFLAILLAATCLDEREASRPRAACQPPTGSA